MKNREGLAPPAFQDPKTKYLAHARLIDTSEARVLWQGISDVEGHTSLTMSDVENEGDGKKNFLEGEFKILANRCLKQLVEQFSNTNPPQ